MSRRNIVLDSETPFKTIGGGGQENRRFGGFIFYTCFASDEQSGWNISTSRVIARYFRAR